MREQPRTQRRTGDRYGAMLCVRRVEPAPTADAGGITGRQDACARYFLPAAFFFLVGSFGRDLP